MSTDAGAGSGCADDTNVHGDGDGRDGEGERRDMGTGNGVADNAGGFRMPRLALLDDLLSRVRGRRFKGAITGRLSPRALLVVDERG